MKTLPLKLKRRGVFYDQVKRSEAAAIYSLRHNAGGRIVGYDVYRVLCRGEHAFKGKNYPTAERVPWDREWGQRAWSFTALKAAEEKFSELSFDATPVRP